MKNRSFRTTKEKANIILLCKKSNERIIAGFSYITFHILLEYFRVIGAFRKMGFGLFCLIVSTVPEVSVAAIEYIYAPFSLGVSKKFATHQNMSQIKKSISEPCSPPG